ncbi:aspartate/glutamate racemase family protein [Arcanobacterium hippocoleae]
MERKRLGILGGLGPAASVYLTDQIVQLTDASSDQEHLDFVLLNRPQIPDRTAFYSGKVIKILRLLSVKRCGR